MEQKTKPLMVFGHLGLGDHFIINGLIRTLAKREPSREIWVLCKYHNSPTVKWMFSDLDRVKAFEIKDDTQAQSVCRTLELGTMCDVLKLGVHAGNYRIPKDWDEWFYRQAGIDHEARWSEFSLPWHTLPKMTPHWPIFWHDDPRREYRITMTTPKSIVYKPDPAEPFAHHIRPLQSADEIHVIDSCFLCVADTIPTNAKRLVLHMYATKKDINKRTGPPTLRKNWEVLN